MSDPLFDVSGKSIVIAGACGGLGSAIARMLGERGAHLTLTDRDHAALEKLSDTIAGKVACFEINVVDETDTIAVLQSASDTYGGIDVLINATGAFVTGPADQLAAEDFRHTLDVNTTGAFLLSRAAAKHMSSAGGSIVHIASVSSIVANPNYAAYATSKAALSQLVRVLAREWAPQNIRVNAIGPAMTETPLTTAHLAGNSFRDQALSVIPMGRLGQPEDLLGTILLLCTSGGNYITGQTIYVDGGRTLV
ncbi:MAG: NAD(P)-dependent dehydrogenase (short-subunit alcohol dehydrogenase family) [Alphaproteobacteria bacterium]|jgi:NAD(P)-dependent dehydrogenase (short-subunit alcohol dehydrogenase family)